MTTRTSLSVAIASVLVGSSLLSGTAATPIARADDPLAPIIAAVNGDRSRTRCPAYTYSHVLEDAAQKWARNGAYAVAGGKGGYDDTEVFDGSGDPQAAAINNAYKKGAGDWIGNCAYTEFGVGFLRDSSTENDVVAILFGKPAPVDAVPAPTPATEPRPAPPLQCPVGSPTPNVPAGQICAPPPTNSVTMAVSGAGFGKINVTLTNSAAIDASCAYTATPVNNLGGILQPINRSIAVQAKGMATLNENSPLPGSTYHLTVSCTGTFNGKNVELGHPARDVSG